jgi:alpha-beta hydrolase superfamily lysophospholipase
MTQQKDAIESKIVNTPKIDIEVSSQRSLAPRADFSDWDVWKLLCPKDTPNASAITPLPSEYKSVNVMQLPGYGKSKVTASVDSLTLDDYLDAMDQVIQSNDAVLFGYSHAGYFTAQYALRNPTKVRALVLVEPALFTPKQDLLERIRLIGEGKDQQAMSSMLKFVGATQEQREGGLANSLLASVNSSSVVAQEYRIRAENEVTEEALAKLDIPVLLVGGTKSTASFMIKRAFQAIPLASVSWISGASHLDLGNSEYEKQVDAAVNAFLQSLGAANAKIFQEMVASIGVDKLSTKGEVAESIA